MEVPGRVRQTARRLLETAKAADQQGWTEANTPFGVVRVCHISELRGPLPGVALESFAWAQWDDPGGLRVDFDLDGHIRAVREV